MTDLIDDPAGPDQRPDLDWSDGVPVARRFDDPYYSLENGLAETRHVFLQGNGLPDRFQPGFHIAELGFGTGLNCLTALLAWRTSGQTGPLRFSSFEAFPMPPADMARALQPFAELGDLADWLPRALAGSPDRVTTDELDLTIIRGDARQTVPDWSGQADAWFLDGFAPAKNPELWEPALLSAVGRKTARGGTFATYTAAGTVRRALAEAGFHVTRTQGFGRKRHMTTGVMA